LVERWAEVDPEFEPRFLTKHPAGKRVDELRRRSLPFEMIPFRGWAGPAKNPPLAQQAFFARTDYAAVTRMLHLMSERRPDVVVTNTLVAPWGAFAAATAGIPHVWMVREYGDLDHGLTFQNSRADTLADIGRMSVAVIANSHALADHLGRYIDPAKISVSYPDVDGERLRRLAAEHPSQPAFAPVEGALKVAVVGRLSESKGQWRVVDALAELSSRGVQVVGCFVGGSAETDDEARLRARIRARDLQGLVNVVGEQVNPFAFAQAADVCITPSGIEAFGRTTFEYLHLGKPVIATSTGGSAELIGGGGAGILVSPDRPRELVDALAWYAADRSRIAAGGEAASRRALELGKEPSYDAAIETIKSGAHLLPYELPQIARIWFELPQRIWEAGSSGVRVRIRFLVYRLLALARRRGIGILRRPRPRRNITEVRADQAR
jgi:glycosyltransferase involved in cell wall biosynthesis